MNENSDQWRAVEGTFLIILAGTVSRGQVGQVVASSSWTALLRSAKATGANFSKTHCTARIEVTSAVACVMMDCLTEENLPTKHYLKSLQVCSDTQATDRIYDRVDSAEQDSLVVAIATDESRQLPCL